MRVCAFCGHPNPDSALECGKCRANIELPALRRKRQYGLLWAHTLRKNALLMIVFGLVVKVYGGAQGPLPLLNNPAFQNVRVWLEPVLLYGGAALYALGWVLNWV